jgi:hypothetical protein
MTLFFLIFSRSDWKREKRKSCVCSIVSPLVSSNTRRERVLAKGSEREGRGGGLRHIEWVYVCLWVSEDGPIDKEGLADTVHQTRPRVELKKTREGHAVDALSRRLSYFVSPFSFVYVVLSPPSPRDSFVEKRGWWMGGEGDGGERSALTQAKHRRAPSVCSVCSCVHLVIGYADQWQSGNGGVLSFRRFSHLTRRRRRHSFFFFLLLLLLISYGYLLGFPWLLCYCRCTTEEPLLFLFFPLTSAPSHCVCVCVCAARRFLLSWSRRRRRRRRHRHM